MFDTVKFILKTQKAKAQSNGNIKVEPKPFQESMIDPNSAAMAAFKDNFKDFLLKQESKSKCLNLIFSYWNAERDTLAQEWEWNA